MPAEVAPKTSKRRDMPVRELAVLLGLSERLVESMCRYRKGRFFFLGARETKEGWFVPARSVERALKVAEIGLCLSVVEVAAILGLNKSTVSRLVTAGTLPRVEIPGVDDVRVPAKALNFSDSELESLKERKGMHSEEGGSGAKGRDGWRGPNISGRKVGAKWYGTAGGSVARQRVTRRGGGCGGRREQNEGGGEGGRGSGRGPGGTMD